MDSVQHLLLCNLRFSVIYSFWQDLLLLQQLTRNNTNIQKIVAFENAFERLFDIIRDEGNSDGGQTLLLNLTWVLPVRCAAYSAWQLLWLGWMRRWPFDLQMCAMAEYDGNGWLLSSQQQPMKQLDVLSLHRFFSVLESSRDFSDSC